VPSWTDRLRRLIPIDPRELALVSWSWAFFFFVLTAYYVIRPIRDDMGVASGVENLPWLFTGTLVSMAAMNPLFGFVAARMPRARVVSLGYRFFAVNLVLFFLLFRFITGETGIWAGRVFFVWTAVFNMFAVSMFWSVMTDVFSASDGKRLFGFIGAGGTLGSIAGSSLTSGLVGIAGSANLLLLSAALLEAAAFTARRVFRESEGRLAKTEGVGPRESLLGGRAWDGFERTASDPYLRGIAVHVVLFTVLTTFLYFQQAVIVDAAISDRVERTRFFANVDLAVNSITLATQSFATGHLMRVFGLSSALAFLPALSLVGFTALGASPTIFVLMAFQVLRRSGEFAIARPAREVLFTVAARGDRYKAKNFIDTFIYRAGDQIGAWTYALLVALGLSVSGVSVVAALLACASIGLAAWLARCQHAKAVRFASSVPTVN
jgi:ATP:ADP antiporter, AAA family